MPIQPMTKAKSMRPSAIDTIDKINEIITRVNELDSNDYQTEIDALTTRVSNTETQLTAVNKNIETIESTNTAQQSDIDNIKETLYTPLVDDVPDPT